MFFVLEHLCSISGLQLAEGSRVKKEISRINCPLKLLTCHHSRSSKHRGSSEGRPPASEQWHVEGKEKEKEVEKEKEKVEEAKVEEVRLWGVGSRQSFAGVLT